jgi:pyrimidine deaminase RibD-like protein
LDELSNVDRQFYNAAVVIAEESMQANEVPVGCVIVFEGEIIGRGHNEVNKRRNSTYHAEMIAIDQVRNFDFYYNFLILFRFLNGANKLNEALTTLFLSAVYMSI